MATLRNVGPPVQGDTANAQQAYDLVNYDYVQSVVAANLAALSAAQITDRINSQANLGQFATQAYATQAMMGLATPAGAAADEALYIPNSLVGAPNGPLVLDAVSGRISSTVISAPNQQRWPTPFFTPTTYGSLATSSVSAVAESQLFTVAVPDPGYSYKLFASGLVDTMVSQDNGDIPQVLVRQGSTTGPIVAFGYGLGQYYRWGVDGFTTASSTSIGGGDWAQYYGAGYELSKQGSWNNATAGTVSWTGNTTPDPSTCRAISKDPVYGQTQGDYQIVSIATGSKVIDSVGFGSLDQNPSNDIFARVDSTGSYYIRCKIGPGNARLYYSNGGGGEIQIGGAFNCTQRAGTLWQLYAGVGGNIRQFKLVSVYNGTTTTVGTWTDSTASSSYGGPYRGWGFGANTETLRILFIPASLYYPSSVIGVAITDPALLASSNPNNYSEATVIPAPLSNQSVLTGATTLYVMLKSSGTSSVTATNLNPQLWVMPIPQ